jgi:predicted nucleic acid-binding Zn ribbon protein
VVFKGSGFYKTDSANTTSAKKESTPSTPAPTPAPKAD